MSMKILVTGGAGFIGSNFIHYLFKHYRDEIFVHNVDALTYAGNLNNLASIQCKSNYFFHKIDISETEAVDTIFSRHTIDVVVHFAAESHVDRSIIDSSPFIKTNLLGTQVLIDSCRKYSIKKFIHVSTDEVYGSLSLADSKFNEETPIKPNSPYSASKAGSDLLVRAAVETFGFPGIITRCSNNYGAYQFPEKMIPLMITYALEDRALPIYGKGENIRDWIFVDDHCRGIDLALRKGSPGNVYNFGGNSEIQNLDLVKKILKILNKSETLIQFVKDRPGHDFRYAIDYSKAERDLGFRPTMSLDGGLKETVDWYVSNEAWWKDITSGDYRHYDDLSPTQNEFGKSS